MTAAPAPPTCEEEAAELLPCRGKGCGGGLHFAKCPTYYIDVVAAALRARQMKGRREAATEADIVTWNMAEKDRIASAIAALPEVP